MAGARTTRIVKPIYVWIPPQYSANPKVTLTSASAGATDDVTDELVSMEVEDGVTDIIGRFKVSMFNANEEYTGRYNKMDVLRFYCDYADTSTTLRFKGLVETVSYKDNMVEIGGRSEGLRYINLTVTATFDNIDCSNILKVLAQYVPGFTYTNVTMSGVLVTKNWTEKPFFDCVVELANDCGFDVYIDCNNDWHFFLHGSVENETDGVTDEFNIISIGDFYEDPTNIKNQVIVYGAERDGIQIIATAEDITSQSGYVISREVINDSDITSEVQAQELADYTLAKLKDEQTVGEVECLMLATIQPGEKIPLNSPANNLTNRKYVAQSYSHKIGNNGFTTSIRIEKQPRNIVNVIKGLIKSDSQKESTSLNPDQMKYSFSSWFDSDFGSHTNSEIADGVLRLQAGQTSGTWVSDTRTSIIDVSQAYLILEGIYLAGVTISLSVDGGISYTTLPIKQSQVITVPGKSLIIKAVFSSGDSEIESLSVMYK